MRVRGGRVQTRERKRGRESSDRELSDRNREPRERKKERERGVEREEKKDNEFCHVLYNNQYILNIKLYHRRATRKSFSN